MATKATKKPIKKTTRPTKPVQVKPAAKQAPVAPKKGNKFCCVSRALMWIVVVALVLVGIYIVAYLGVNRAIDKSSFCGDALTPELCECVQGAAKRELSLISKIKLVRGKANLSDTEINKLANSITTCIMNKSEAVAEESIKQITE